MCMNPGNTPTPEKNHQSPKPKLMKARVIPFISVVILLTFCYSFQSIGGKKASQATFRNKKLVQQVQKELEKFLQNIPPGLEKDHGF